MVGTQAVHTREMPLSPPNNTMVTSTNSTPPVTHVGTARAEVSSTRATALAWVNEAKAYQNAKLPDAQAQADQLRQNAQYLKQKRINEAIEAVAMFEAMYAEYVDNREITKSRMYYEAIAQVLPGVKVVINTGDGSAVDYVLPLEPIVGGK